MGLHQGRKDEKTRKDGLGRQFARLVAVFFEIQQAHQQNDRQNDDETIEEHRPFSNIFELEAKWIYLI